MTIIVANLPIRFNIKNSETNKIITKPSALDNSLIGKILNGIKLLRNSKTIIREKELALIRQYFTQLKSDLYFVKLSEAKTIGITNPATDDII